MMISIGSILFLITLITVPTAFVRSILAPVRLLRYITHCGVGTQILLGMLIPVSRVVLFVMIVGGILWAGIYLAIALSSMRIF